MTIAEAKRNFVRNHDLSHAAFSLRVNGAFSFIMAYEWSIS